MKTTSLFIIWLLALTAFEDTVGENDVRLLGVGRSSGKVAWSLSRDRFLKLPKWSPGDEECFVSPHKAATKALSEARRKFPAVDEWTVLGMEMQQYFFSLVPNGQPDVEPRDSRWYYLVEVIPKGKNEAATNAKRYRHRLLTVVLLDGTILEGRITDDERN